jgi:hypothetical protein
MSSLADRNPPPPTSQAVAAFTDRYNHLAGGVLKPEAAYRWVRNGWTIDLLEHVRELAEAAVERNAAVCSDPGPNWSSGGRAEQATYSLVELINDWRSGGRPADFLGWATIAALAPDRATWLDVRGEEPLRPEASDPYTARVHPERQTLEAWSNRTHPVLAPLVYAAGLTLEEARDRYAAEDLNVTALRSLAALRGYPMP